MYVQYYTHSTFSCKFLGKNAKLLYYNTTEYIPSNVNYDMHYIPTLSNCTRKVIIVIIHRYLLCTRNSYGYRKEPHYSTIISNVM